MPTMPLSPGSTPIASPITTPMTRTIRRAGSTKSQKACAAADAMSAGIPVFPRRRPVNSWTVPKGSGHQFESSLFLNNGWPAPGGIYRRKEEFTAQWRGSVKLRRSWRAAAPPASFALSFGELHAPCRTVETAERTQAIICSKPDQFGRERHEYSADLEEAPVAIMNAVHDLPVMRLFVGAHANVGGGCQSDPLA